MVETHRRWAGAHTGLGGKCGLLSILKVNLIATGCLFASLGQSVADDSSSKGAAATVDRLLTVAESEFPEVLREVSGSRAGIGQALIERTASLRDDVGRIRVARAFRVFRDPIDGVVESLVTLIVTARDRDLVRGEVSSTLAAMGPIAFPPLVSTSTSMASRERVSTVAKLVIVIAKKTPGAAVALAEIMYRADGRGKQECVEVLLREPDRGVALLAKAGTGAELEDKLKLGSAIAALGEPGIPQLALLLEAQYVDPDMQLVCVYAAELLGPKGRELARLMIKLAKSPTATVDVRTHSVIALSKMARESGRLEESLGVLMVAARASDYRLRCAALEGLWRVGERNGAVSEVYLDGMRDPQLVVRCQAFAGVSRVGELTTATIAALLAGLSDVEPIVQIAAAQASIEMNQAVLEAGLVLGTALGSTDEIVRESATRTMAYFDEEHAGQLTTTLLAAGRLTIPKELARIRILGLVRSPSAARITEFLQLRSVDTDQSVRESAVKALEGRSAPGK